MPIINLSAVRERDLLRNVQTQAEARPVAGERIRVPLERIEQISLNVVRYADTPIANVNDRATFV